MVHTIPLNILTEREVKSLYKHLTTRSSCQAEVIGVAGNAAPSITISLRAEDYESRVNNLGNRCKSLVTDFCRWVKRFGQKDQLIIPFFRVNETQHQTYLDITWSGRRRTTCAAYLQHGCLNTFLHTRRSCFPVTEMWLHISWTAVEWPPVNSNAPTLEYVAT